MPIALPRAILLLIAEGESIDLAGLLREAGHDVTTTPTHADARSLLAQRRYDLLIVEAAHSRLFDGLMLIGQARRDRPELAAIIITASYQPWLELEAGHVGAAYRARPIDPIELLALVGRQLPEPAPVRRSPRKLVKTGVAATIAEWPATIWNVSYEGCGFEVVPQIWQEPLPSAFKVNLPNQGLSLSAVLVWTKRTSASGPLRGGAAVLQTDPDAVSQWHGFVDRLPEDPGARTGDVPPHSR